MKSFLTATVLLLVGATARGQIYYDINFNSPAHTVGTVVSSGVGTNVVSAVTSGSPLIVSSYNNLTDQPIRFDMTGNTWAFFEDQFRLNLAGSLASQVRVDFDFDSIGFIGSTARFTILFDTPTIRNVEFFYDGSISLYGKNDTAWYFKTIGSIVDRTKYHFTIAIDQENGFWGVLRDGMLLGTGVWAADSGIQSIRFAYGLHSFNTLPDGSSVGIDNLVVAALSSASPVPEPSTYATLGMLFLLALAFFRRFSRS